MPTDPRNSPDQNPSDATQGLSTGAPGGPAAGQIGPYRLLHALGEGGMGEVWLAEQKSPIQRTVALKVIKPGMDSKAVIARFESERQALALMDHPNIARVFDAGSTPEGRPYFVMEYVPGLPITEYCDKHKLTVRQRLELFLQVCDGVQHAHQKAIIHRDLKPSNVLVMDQNDKPVPKIIDFGLAKATAQRLTDKTLFTEFGTMLGTPEYMSPEQADQNEQNIDTRTDVYSLGVILYQLLVGVLPFEVKALRAAGLEAVLRVIREQDPPKPSTRIRSMGDASSAVAESRCEQPNSFARHLQGELDWITMKALEKDRARRYGSPSELAADIDRHLHDRTVLAGAPSNAYRASKFVKRHRGMVAAMVAAVVLSIAFAVAMAIQLRRITRERDRADRIAEFMTEMFKVSRPTEARGNSVTAREILDKASNEIETGLRDDPRLQAQLMRTMAETYRGLGLYDHAQELAQRALAIQQRVLGPDDRDTLATTETLGWIALGQGRYADAEKSFRAAADGRSRVLGPENPQTLSAYASLGWTIHQEGRYSEGDKLLSDALEKQRRILGPEHSSTMATTDNLALSLIREKRYAEAETLERENLETRRRKLGADHPDTLFSMRNLAYALQQQGQFAEAEKLQRQILDARVRLLGPDHPETLLSQRDLALTLSGEGNYAEAETLFRNNLDARTRTLGADDLATLVDREYLAIDLSHEGRYAEAEKLFRQSLDAAQKANRPAAVRLAWYNFACGAAAAGRTDEAFEYLGRAIDLGYGPADSIANDTDLASLRNDPRFAALLAKIPNRANAPN